MPRTMATGTGDGSATYLETHALRYAKTRRQLKAYIEVEEALQKHNWILTGPVKGWVEYSYQNNPPAKLPGPVEQNIPFLVSLAALDSDDWKLQHFHPSVECVQQFAEQVNGITGDQVLLVQEKSYYWLREQETSNGAQDEGGEGKTYELLNASTGRQLRTYMEVEDELREHHWRLSSDEGPVNGWVEYIYQPPDRSVENVTSAVLPAPPVTRGIHFSVPPPLPEDWRLQYFHSSVECLQQFAAQVNETTGEGVLIVQERSYCRLVVRKEDSPGELSEGVQVEGVHGAAEEGQLEEVALN